MLTCIKRAIFVSNSGPDGSENRVVKAVEDPIRELGN